MKKIEGIPFASMETVGKALDFFLRKADRHSNYSRRKE
jgi:hypothetical protein